MIGLDNLNFLEEEIILREEKIKRETDAFTNSTITTEKNTYGRFKVIKVGKEQTQVKVDDYVLVSKNGMPDEINIEGQILPNTYALMNHKRIFCILNE